MDKKRSLRNKKLNANRASETEQQRKERLAIRREKDRETRCSVEHGTRALTALG